MSLSAEANKISKMTGSTVTLYCSNKSANTLSQLTWTMNGENLFTYMLQFNNSIHSSEKATSLNLEKPNSNYSELTIARAQKYHAGNYTCETTTQTGIHQENWELVITEEPKNLEKNLIVVAVAVPCVCFMTFISVFIILRCVRKQPENRTQSAPAEMQQQTEEVYENCLEIQRQALAYGNKHSTR
ncbi:uncharacterized protein PAE49_012965 isoform 2-T2 [Odontesthes bonariensis]|uniref:uncharacterized protein LOC142396590 isoform X2 n=1 Tax=Odontesthes bonariensis TaxID=219752 RepID=UPI003F588839